MQALKIYEPKKQVEKWVKIEKVGSTSTSYYDVGDIWYIINSFEGD